MDIQKTRKWLSEQGFVDETQNDKTRRWFYEQGFAEVNPHVSIEDKEKVGYPLDIPLSKNEYLHMEKLLKESEEEFRSECNFCNNSEMCKIVKRFFGGYLFATTSKEQLMECIDDCRKCVFVSEELLENTGTLAMKKSKYKKEHAEALKKIKLFQKKI